MRKTAILLLLCLPACGPAPEISDLPSGDVVASWMEGQVGLVEIESRYSQARTPACRAARRGEGSVELLIPCYREISEEIVLERQLLAETGEPDPNLLDDGGAELIRHAYLAAFRSTVAREIEVTEEEIRALFEERRETLRRPGALSLWNIFRRHRDPKKPDETTAFLLEIKERVEAGETFQSLAREYSDSETRLRDGFVGRITEGDLPARLEEIAFGLETGEVSEPIPVRGGAVLLYVRDPQPGIQLQLADVRQALRLELQTKKIKERVQERVDGEELPRESIVLTNNQLAAMVATGNGTEIVFEVGERRLNLAELREMTGLPRSQLDENQVDRLGVFYQELVEGEKLYLDLVAADDPLAATVRVEAEEHLHRETVAALLNQTLEHEAAAKIDDDDAALRQYFEDNEHHYQSPLRFWLRVWSQPFASDPPAQLAAMERAHASMTVGKRGLEESAAELGGEIEDLGWRDLDGLSELPEKARGLVLQSETGGYTVPYQQGQVLYIIEVTERREPERLTYQEVAERVREDYLIRFAQRLTREVVEARLTAAEFEFFEDRVLQMIGGP